MSLINNNANEDKKKAIRCKNLFVTYPQNDEKKEDVMKKYLDFYGNDIKFIVVCEENHKDEGKHLHAVIAFDRKLYHKHAVLDGIGGKHGDYQPVRSLLSSVKYVAKDGDYCSTGVDVEKYLECIKKKVSTRIAVNILSGDSVSQIIEKEPGFALMNLNKIQAFKHFIDMDNAAEIKLNPGDLEFVVEQSNNLFNYDIASETIKTWLEENLLRAVDNPRPLKQKQLYVHGPPNMGKTTLIENLRNAGVRIYMMPAGTEFYCDYSDDAYDLIVLDEFYAQKKIQELNRWLDGSHTPLRRKGLPVLNKKKNLPFIILSNYKLEDCYSKCNESRLIPLKARLEFVEVSQFIKVQVIRKVTETEEEEETILVNSSPPQDFAIESIDSSSSDSEPFVASPAGNLLRKRIFAPNTDGKTWFNLRDADGNEYPINWDPSGDDTTQELDADAINTWINGPDNQQWE